MALGICGLDKNEKPHPCDGGKSEWNWLCKACVKFYQQGPCDKVFEKQSDSWIKESVVLADWYDNLVVPPREI